MKLKNHILKSLLLIVILFTSFSSTFSQTKEMNIPIKSEVKWFTDARFGMFIHWSPMAAIDKEIGWSWGYEVDSTSYVARCKAWNPTKFDANAWVTLAKNAGMKYIVFVPKHHDGFSLWDTKATSFNIMNTPYAQDICKQLSEACALQGIAFCTYYSIADLHQNKWSKMCYVGASSYEPVAGGMPKYFEFVKKQIGELITKYHTKNFWFDGFWHPEWYAHPEYRDSLSAYMKRLDPSIIMCRLQMPTTPPGGMWDDGWDFANNIGDYHSREDHGSPSFEKLYYKGPWEYCSSIGYPNYSYHSNTAYKSTKEMIQTMVKIAGRNGNYLLDMGPTAAGEVDAVQTARLTEIGTWLKTYGETIYGTEGGPYLPNGGSFASTRKGDKVYLHILATKTILTVPVLSKEVLSAKIFGTTTAVPFTQSTNSYTFTIPTSYSNANDVIIELTINGLASELDLLSTGFFSNGDLEDGNFGAWYPWSPAGVATISTTNVRNGKYSVLFTGGQSAILQDVTGLKPNTTYRFSGWAKKSSATNVVSIGAKNFGGTNLEIPFTSAANVYGQQSFTFFTGSSTTATVYFTKSAGIGTDYGDDFTLTEVPLVVLPGELLVNPSLETGTATPWTAWNPAGTATISTSNIHEGTYSMKLTGGQSAFLQTVTGLKPKTTYQFSGWAMKSSATNVVSIGAKDFGGTAIELPFTTAPIYYGEQLFYFTTGTTNTTATVYFTKSSGTGDDYGDDFHLNEVGLSSSIPIVSNKKEMIQLYPVPANDYYVVNSNYTTSMNYSLLDVTGKSISTGKLMSGKNSFNCSGLNNGVYYLQVKDVNTNLTKSLVINH